MKIKYWFTGILLVTSLEANQHVLKIDDLVEIALKHSPNIDSSRLDFEGAKQRTKAVEGLYLPRLDLSVDGGKQWMKFKDLLSTGGLLAADLASPVKGLRYSTGSGPHVRTVASKSPRITGRAGCSSLSFYRFSGPATPAFSLYLLIENSRQNPLLPRPFRIAVPTLDDTRSSPAGQGFSAHLPYSRT